VSKRNRTETWLILIAAAVGVVLVIVLGLFGYMTTTAPLHLETEKLPSVARAEPSAEWADAVGRGRRIIRAALIERNLPGLSVAVGVDGDLVWAEGVGWADLEQRVPAAPETRFRIGTASVALTSAAVGRLLEDGRLALDAEIQDYVPAFPRKEWPVTLRQLMGHVAGVRNDGGDEGPLLAERCNRPADALPHFAARPLLFQPGTEFHYSSYGWIAVSAAVETAAGEPFLEFMQAQVFDPLGMDDTKPDSTATPIASRATSYFPRFAADPRYGQHLLREVDYSCYAGASIFLSTPSDLVRFGMALDGGRLLSPATVALLRTSQRLVSGEETGYGLGWDLETVTLDGAPATLVGHDGDILGGNAAALLTFSDRGVTVAVISNISYADTFSVAVQLGEVFQGTIEGTVP
jgi:CubicO group peptidase (beta-lactamase class C family)